HMSLYGKSSKNSDIKPALIELGQVVCTCLEQKAVTIENKLTYEQQDALRNQYLGECFQANLESYRSQLFLEYNIKDQSSIQKFGSISTGFFFTNCTPIIEANAQAKASIWGSGIHLQRNRNYSKSAWTVVNATKEKITDSLANQFINLQSFKDAKAGLAQAQVILKSNPRAYSMTRPKDETKKENRTTQIFNFIANKKALFQLVIEYETDAYSKLRTVVFVPREKIKNLQELDKTLESSPPPPTEELPKND
ncbi:hypothetical protein, partial [Haliscomenobacter sp.]|uniref:hypothetical protein n=1 Tax=Haliscomenobacter sp. TaxID=2717303 RepID=UPI003364DE82